MSDPTSDIDGPVECIGNGTDGSGCGEVQGKSGHACGRCGGMLLSKIALKAADELAAMRQQRDEAQRDAQRYRWLKSKGCDWVTIYQHPSGDEIFDGKGDEKMDERIDAARSRDEKGGGA